jgi:hypothetical protein
MPPPAFPHMNRNDENISVEELNFLRTGEGYQALSIKII